MAQIVPVGMNTVGQTGLYSNVSPVTSEERTVALNGCATRITAVRRYRNWFTQPFTGGSVESGFFTSGHLLLISVSNLTLSPGPSDFTHKKLAAGNYDTDIDTMWDRIAALAFDTNVTSLSRSITTTNTSANIVGAFTGADVGATITGSNIPASTSIISQTGTAAVMSHTATGSGAVTATIVQGLIWPYVEFIYEHEVDAKGVDGKPGNLYYSNGGTSGTKDTATDFINAWRHLWGRWVARAAVAGVPTSRVKFNLCYTAFGFSPDRVTQYWPGDQYVDVVGVDPYPPVTAAGFLTSSAQGGIANARPFVIAHKKPMSIPEWNFISTSDSARPAAFAGMASAMANETQFVYDSACLFLYPDSTPGYAINKVVGDSAGGHAYPLTHAAYASMIATLGGNPIISTVSQADPSQPNILTVTSNNAGTQITVTWDNPPGGDNVTGWNVLFTLGSVTSGLPKINASPLSAVTRTYTFTALASGVAVSPGSNYSVQVVALNAGLPTGQAVSNASFVTANQPGPNPNAPVISAQSALNDVSNANQIDYTITATSPLSRPLTISHQVTGPAGISDVFTGASATRIYATGGTYTDNVTVQDNATPPNVTTTVLSFVVPTGISSTPNLGLYRPQQVAVSDPGFGPGLRGNFDALDTAVGALNVQALSAWNQFYNLAGSSSDPMSSATTATSASTFWYTMVRLEATSFSGVVALLNGPPLAGTGVHVGIHDSAGNVLVDKAGNVADYSGTAVDAWLTGASDIPVRLTFPSGSITKRTFGEFLYVSLYLPSTVSIAPVLYAGNPVGPAVSLLAPSPVTRYGNLTSYNSGIPATLPFGTAGFITAPIWFGLLP